MPPHARRIHDKTPESRALRLRVMKLRRTPCPRGMWGHKEAWVREFLSLWDAQANEAMFPPESRGAYLKGFGVAGTRVPEFRSYLKVYQAGVAAGLAPWHLARTTIAALADLVKLVDDQDALVAALTGSESAVEQARLRRTQQHTAATVRGMKK